MLYTLFFRTRDTAVICNNIIFVGSYCRNVVRTPYDKMCPAATKHPILQPRALLTGRSRSFSSTLQLHCSKILSYSGMIPPPAAQLISCWTALGTSAQANNNVRDKFCTVKNLKSKHTFAVIVRLQISLFFRHHKGVSC